MPDEDDMTALDQMIRYAEAKHVLSEPDSTTGAKHKEKTCKHTKKDSKKQKKEKKYGLADVRDDM